MARSSTLKKSEPAATPASRFTKLDAKGKELAADAAGHVAVRDNTTGLIWPVEDSGKRLTFKQAEAYAKKLKLLGGGWRLPTRAELLTLVDDTRHDPAINTDAFPGCKSLWYWTGTPAAWNPAGAAWYVNFYNGYSSWYNHDNESFVRAVRSGQ